jgi:hypothetical protein
MNMQKTNTYGAVFGLLLWVLSPGLQAQAVEGVGINTENIQGVFHIDAAGNNPASGSISPAQQEDDVVITAEGYVGIGTATPTTRLHIHTQNRNRTGVFPLRLPDGADAGKVITSDEEGNASWIMPPTPPSSFVDNTIKIAPRETYPLGDTTQVTNSVYSVPEDGFYSADLRFWAEWQNINGSTSTTVIQTVTRFQLVKTNGSGSKTVDEFQYNEPSYSRVTVFVTLYASALEGEELSIRVNPAVGNNGLTANPVAGTTYDWIQTKVLYKKLGVDDDTHYFE